MPSLFRFRQMPQNALADQLANNHGNGIADQPADSLHVDGLSWGNESVVLWEALQNRPLTQRNGPVLFRMAEPSVTETEELGGQCRAWLIPAHTSVDARIGSARVFLMAISNEVFRPVPPCPARSGSTYSFQIDRR